MCALNAPQWRRSLIVGHRLGLAREDAQLQIQQLRL